MPGVSATLGMPVYITTRLDAATSGLLVLSKCAGFTRYTPLSSHVSILTVAAADSHCAYFLRVLNNALAGPKSCKHYKALVCSLPGSEPLSPGLLVDWTGPDRRAPRQFVSSPRSVFRYAHCVNCLISHIKCRIYIVFSCSVL